MKRSVRTAIASLYRTGEGVGSLDGKPFRLPGALPGEEVEAERLGGGQAQSYGRILRIIHAHNERVAPPCPVAATCGGCVLQHWSLKGQRRWKMESLQRLVQGSIPVHVEPIRAVGDAWKFRNKGLWMVEPTELGAHLGLYRPRSHELQPLSECRVQDGLTERILGELHRGLAERKFAPWLRAVLVRSNGNEALLTWIVRETPTDQKLEDLRTVAKQLPNVVGTFWNQTPTSGNGIVGQMTHRIEGASHLTISIGDIQFEVGPVSFVQVSLEGAGVLVDEVRKRAGRNLGHVVDVYGGAGMFALALADRGTSVSLVEQPGPSVRDAERNLAGVGRVFAEDAGQIDGILQDADTVVVDPPRSGLAKTVIEALVHCSTVRRVIYVSCSPETLVRDVERLTRGGFIPHSFTPVDLFPHTPHVEVVTHLTRESRAGAASDRAEWTG